MPPTHYGHSYIFQKSPSNYLMLTPCTLAAITDAAARCVPIGGIAAAAGLSKAEWKAALRDEHEAVRLAVLRGRLLAFMENAESLGLCSSRYGKAAVALFILQKDHSWPSRGRGRPRSTPR